jgi:hypothetical protein
MGEREGVGGRVHRVDWSERGRIRRTEWIPTECIGGLDCPKDDFQWSSSLT